MLLLFLEKQSGPKQDTVETWEERRLEAALLGEVCECSKRSQRVRSESLRQNPYVTSRFQFIRYFVIGHLGAEPIFMTQETPLYLTLVRSESRSGEFTLNLYGFCHWH
jgi:hypothetical protein